MTNEIITVENHSVWIKIFAYDTDWRRKMQILVKKSAFSLQKFFSTSRGKYLPHNLYELRACIFK